MAVQVSVVCSLYGLKVKPDEPIHLSEEFREDLKFLEEEGGRREGRKEEGGRREERGEEGARFFIQKWGTHWRSRVFMGGRVSMSFFVDEALANLHSMDFVTKQAESYFLSYIGAQQNEEVLEEFLSSTSISELEILGGDPSLLQAPSSLLPSSSLPPPSSSSLSWKAWTQTIIDDPAVIWEELAPLEALIGDLLTSKVKSRLTVAIRNYLYKPGCTHPYARNYNPLATVDDESCLDPVVVAERLRCRGTGRISSFPPNCLETRISNQSLQIFCVDGVTRFCLSSQRCPWEGGGREEGREGGWRREGGGEEGKKEVRGWGDGGRKEGDGWENGGRREGEGWRDTRSCLQEGLSSDWMATIVCGEGWKGGRHVFCGGEEEAYLK